MWFDPKALLIGKAPPANFANSANFGTGKVAQATKHPPANFANSANLGGSTAPSMAEISKLAELAAPGMAAMFALADRYCDATQASDKAKAAWPADIKATPPELRGDLAAYLREQLAAMPKQASTVKAAPMPPTTPPPPKPTPRFSVHAPWNVADNAYQNHHWQCPQCRVNARTRDREPRCAIGQELYTAYESAAMKGHQ